MCKNYYFIWGCLVISKEQQVQINEDIRDKEVRVIGSDGGQLGIMSASEALEKAAEANLDLVKIAPQAVPPVCKIMDYGKYRFEQQKREKEAKKNQRTFDIKEVRLSLGIDTHDFETKVKQAAKFMKKFAEALADVAVVEKPAKLEGRSMMMFLAAKPNK